MPLFSIVTPTYQCAEKLRATAESVLTQPAHLFEYLIIDARSTDGTREWIEQLRARAANVRSVSEADNGIYDAMNKGIRMATGQFVHFLGAGDRLREGALEAVAAEIARVRARSKVPRPLFLYGNVVWSRYKRPYDGRSGRFKILRRNLPHQAIFHERSVYERLGYYNTDYCVRADWDFNLRAFCDPGIAKHYFPCQVAVYEGGGRSDTEDDPIFNKDFPRLVQKHRGLWAAVFVRVASLLAHPRDSFYYRPRRFFRRIVRARASASRECRHRA